MSVNFEQFIFSELEGLHKKIDAVKKSRGTERTRKRRREQFVVQEKEVSEEDQALFTKLLGREHPFNRDLFITLLKKEVSELQARYDQEHILHQRVEQEKRLSEKRMQKDREQHILSTKQKQERIDTLTNKNAELVEKMIEATEDRAVKNQMFHEGMLNYIKHQNEQKNQYLKEKQELVDEKAVLDTQKGLLRSSIRELERMIEKGRLDDLDYQKFYYDDINTMKHAIEDMRRIITETNTGYLEKKNGSAKKRSRPNDRHRR